MAGGLCADHADHDSARAPMSRSLKVCRKLRSPVPGRGYWAKKEDGHIVTRKFLPELAQTIVVNRNVPSTAETAHQEPVLHKDDEAEFDSIDQLLLDSTFAF